MHSAAGVVPMLPLLKKKSGTPTSAADPKHTSCRFVRPITLSAYVHWQLTGQRVLGVGDASGMFPIDIDRQDYRQDMLDAFDRLVAPKEYPWKRNNCSIEPAGG